MFIVHSVGADEESPFKVFTSVSDAKIEAENRAWGSVERVFIYEWAGELREGLEAARSGRLQPMLHYSHREAPRTPLPEPPIRLTKNAEKQLAELVKKMPKIARKF